LRLLFGEFGQVFDLQTAELKNMLKKVEELQELVQEYPCLLKRQVLAASEWICAYQKYSCRQCLDWPILYNNRSTFLQITF